MYVASSGAQVWQVPVAAQDVCAHAPFPSHAPALPFARRHDQPTVRFFAPCAQLLLTHAGLTQSRSTASLISHALSSHGGTANMPRSSVRFIGGDWTPIRLLCTYMMRRPAAISAMSV
jgi:hypothetical protein